MVNKKLFYLIYPEPRNRGDHESDFNKRLRGKSGVYPFRPLTFETFEDKDKCRERAKVIDMMPATEWIVIEGTITGFALGEAIDFFEDKSDLR